MLGNEPRWGHAESCMQSYRDIKLIYGHDWILRDQLIVALKMMTREERNQLTCTPHFNDHVHVKVEVTPLLLNLNLVTLTKLHSRRLGEEACTGYKRSLPLDFRELRWVMWTRDSNPSFDMLLNPCITGIIASFEWTRKISRLCVSSTFFIR